MYKFCVRLIPRTLTDENKKTRVSASMEFLHRQTFWGEGIRQHYMTDGTMINPETKQESSIWKPISCRTLGRAA